MKDRRMVLASGSSRRKEILTKHGFEFEVIVSEVDESVAKELTPEQAAMYVAYKKAKTVSALLYKECEDEGEMLIIAADTIVYKDKIMGKPIDENNAIEMLSHLRNGNHDVITGVAVIDERTKKQILFYDKTTVFFKNYDDETIKKYVASGEVWDKAGSYAIQGEGAMLCEKIEGDLENVIGLPFTKLEQILQKNGLI